MAGGDHEAFTQWARQRQTALLRTAVLVTGDHQRAEDLVQEALTNISWWRRRRREVVSDAAAQRGTAAGVQHHSESRLALDRALASLTPRQRAVIVLRFYDDLTERATADTLGVAPGTVKSQTHLALRRLRETSPHLAEMLEDYR